MAVYIEQFTLPIDEEEKIVVRQMEHNGGGFGYIDNLYPSCIFGKKQLRQVDFEPITIFYGSNGSGKSTLLNLIANKLKLARTAPFNNSELFDSYVTACDYRLGYDDRYVDVSSIPDGSKLIASDDIFDLMLTKRESNQEIARNSEQWRSEDYAKLKFGETIRFNGMEDYDRVKLQLMARQKSLSRRKFIYKIAGKEEKLNSNGETALTFFENELKDNCLYCLDEPENSLSPKFQQEIVEIIEYKSRYCGCQFIIATHSPFVLAITGGKIYDLDAVPVDIKKWWQLDNTKAYFEFFMKHSKLFSGEEDS